MFRNYLVTAWRHMLRNARFSIINIFGLAIGLASCILIMLFVRAESGYDSWIPNSERIVRLHTGYHTPGRPPFLTVRSAGRMMEAIKDYADTQVEQGVRLIHFSTAVQKDGDAFSETFTIADGSFFEVFDLPFAEGAAQSAFSKPNDLVVTEEIAMKYFGSTDVIGKTLTMCCLADQIIALPITGVIKNLPEQTHLSLDLIVRLQPSLFENDTNTLHTWNSVNVYTYFKMHSGVTQAQLQGRITHWLDNESPFVQNVKDFAQGGNDNIKASDVVKHKLMALQDLHLYAKKDAGSMGDISPMGDAKMVYTFALVALLILIIACFNFMNLSTARATQRAREVAMRKVLGASRSQVAVQFLGESVATVLIAMVFALVIVELVLPMYSQTIGRSLDLALFSDLPLLFSLLTLAVAVGVLAGLYPALVLSRFLPSQILKSNKSSQSSGSAVFRTTLVVLQFSISIILIICTAVIYSQTRYAQSIDVGYNSDNKLVLRVRAASGQLDSLKQELLALPGVQSVAYSSEAPTQDNENNTTFTLVGTQQSDGQTQTELLNYYHTDYDFFADYHIFPVAGRVFDRSYGNDRPASDDQQQGSVSIIVNESAARKFGFSDTSQAVGKSLQRGSQGQSFNIIGVIPDLYFRSIKFGIRPSVYMLDPGRYRVATLTVSPLSNAELIDQIDQIWKKYVPAIPMDLSYLDEMMAAQYEDERIQTRLFSVFSLLAIVIACLGLFGLATFTTSRRRKEIGIRKVMGARVRDIVTLLIWQFSKPVIAANFIAWPIAGYVMISWLEQFPYRIDLLYLLPISLAVGVCLLLLAWLTVGSNAAKVARANPVGALRQE